MFEAGHLLLINLLGSDYLKIGGLKTFPSTSDCSNEKLCVGNFPHLLGSARVEQRITNAKEPRTKRAGISPNTSFMKFGFNQAEKRLPGSLPFKLGPGIRIDECPTYKIQERFTEVGPSTQRLEDGKQNRQAGMEDLTAIDGYLINSATVGFNPHKCSF